MVRVSVGESQAAKIAHLSVGSARVRPAPHRKLFKKEEKIRKASLSSVGTQEVLNACLLTSE